MFNDNGKKNKPTQSRQGDAGQGGAAPAPWSRARAASPTSTRRRRCRRWCSSSRPSRAAGRPGGSQLNCNTPPHPPLLPVLTGHVSSLPRTNWTCLVPSPVQTGHVRPSWSASWPCWRSVSGKARRPRRNRRRRQQTETLPLRGAATTPPQETSSRSQRWSAGPGRQRVLMGVAGEDARGSVARSIAR